MKCPKRGAAFCIEEHKTIRDHLDLCMLTFSGRLLFHGQICCQRGLCFCKEDRLAGNACTHPIPKGVRPPNINVRWYSLGLLPLPCDFVVWSTTKTGQGLPHLPRELPSGAARSSSQVWTHGVWTIFGDVFSLGHWANEGPVGPTTATTGGVGIHRGDRGQDLASWVCLDRSALLQRPAENRVKTCIRKII